MDAPALNPRVAEAAAWFATTPRSEIKGPIVPTLRALFGLTLIEAVAAIREANLIKARAT